MKMNGRKASTVKRFWSILLCLAMMLMMFPFTVRRAAPLSVAVRHSPMWQLTPIMQRQSSGQKRRTSPAGSAAVCSALTTTAQERRLSPLSGGIWENDRIF